MPDIEFARRIEEVGEDTLADERTCRKRCHELLGGFGQDAAYGKVALFQSPDEIERFIGRDAAADDEQHAFRLRCYRATTDLATAFHRKGRRHLARVAGGCFSCLPKDRAHLVLDRASAAGCA